MHFQERRDSESWRADGATEMNGPEYVEGELWSKCMPWEDQIGSDPEDPGGRCVA